MGLLARPPVLRSTMSELEQLRQEAEQLRNQIRVRDWGWVGAGGRWGPRGLQGLELQPASS